MKASTLDTLCQWLPKETPAPLLFFLVCACNADPQSDNIISLMIVVAYKEEAAEEERLCPSHLS